MYARDIKIKNCLILLCNDIFFARFNFLLAFFEHFRKG